MGIVNSQILDGKELLNERTNTENRYLKKVGGVQFTQLLNVSTVLLVLESVQLTVLRWYLHAHGLSVNRALLTSLSLTETRVMEASLSDYRRQQRELRQGMFR